MVHDGNFLLTLSVVLVAGVASGMAARRLHLPAVTGQILVGLLLGPTVLGFFSSEEIHSLQPITHFALGLIAVAVGSHLHFQKLRHAARRLLLVVLLEATITPPLVYLSVRFFTDHDWPLAALLATLAVATAPATVVAVIKESRSKGVFVKTLLGAVALNNIACICLFEVAHTAARLSLDPSAAYSPTDVLAAPLRQLLASVLLGGIVGAALALLARRVVRTETLTTASTIAILLTVGLADYLEISSLLSCLFMGMVLENLTPETDVGHTVFENFENIIFAAFFMLAGMELDLEMLITGGLFLAAIVALARAAGKVIASNVGMRLAGTTERMRRNLGIALLPQAGVAVGLMLLIKEDPVFSSLSDVLLAIGIAVVTINELLGPILTRIALRRSGDFGNDRARLIDFLHEENIVTDFKADTKDEAIEKLTDLLIQTNHLNLDRDQLLKSVLDREREASTCIGSGLAIPHAVLEEGNALVGVMGISRQGLDFKTPDGQPVHCMVLLATPASMRNRHLEVLAALARSIGSDYDIQRHLFTAHSPAHAYEILHVEELSDFNYFLEEESA